MNTATHTEFQKKANKVLNISENAADKALNKIADESTFQNMETAFIDGADAVKKFVSTVVVDKVFAGVKTFPKALASLKKRPVLLASSIIAVGAIGAYFYFSSQSEKKTVRI